MSATPNDFAKAFVDMSEAYTKLPGIEAELTTVKSELSDKIVEVSTLHNIIDGANARAEAQANEISRLREELNQARFREEHTSATLANIKGLLGVAFPEPEPVKAVESVIEPAPEPSPEPVEDPTLLPAPTMAVEPVEQPKPYAGRQITERPWQMSEAEWVAGGGESSHAASLRINQPYGGMWYWEKPDGVTRSDFELGGGETKSAYDERSNQSA